MTVSSVDHVMSRIQLATEESPIAVFGSGFSGRLNAVFGATARSQAKIEHGKCGFIGLFHRGMEREDVFRLLVKEAG